MCLGIPRREASVWFYYKVLQGVHGNCRIERYKNDLISSPATEAENGFLPRRQSICALAHKLAGKKQKGPEANDKIWVSILGSIRKKLTFHNAKPLSRNMCFLE